MKKKLLSIVLSILMIVTVTQVNVHAETSVEGIDFDPYFILDDLHSVTGNRYNIYTDLINARFVELSLSPHLNPGIDFESSDVTIFCTNEAADDGTFQYGFAYKVKLIVYCEEGYLFDKGSDYYINNIEPTPCQIDILQEQKCIFIYYSYNEEGLLDYGGGGSGDSGNSITSIDLENILPSDMSEFYNKNYNYFANIITSRFLDFEPQFTGIDIDSSYVTVTNDGGNDGETILEDNSYNISLVIKCKGDYLFNQNVSVSPTPNAKEVSGERKEITIDYHYTNGILDSNGGGGSTTGSIEELDLLSDEFSFPQYEDLVYRTCEEVFLRLRDVNIDHTNYCGFKVWNQTDNAKMEDWDMFESGKCYVLSVFFTAQNGYNFDSISIDDINPRPNAIKKGFYKEFEQEVDEEGENSAIQIMYCFYDTSNQSYINSIDLSDLEVGYYEGKKVSDIFTLINGLNLTNMTVIPEGTGGPIACFENISGEPFGMGVNDTFQDKERYHMSFILKANDNYSFPFMVLDYYNNYYIYAGSYDVGSEIADCSFIIDDFNDDSINDVKVICEFTIGDIPASAYIKNINFNGVIPNDFSQYEDLKASELISSVNSWNFGELINKGFICYKENSGSFTKMTSTESFVVGKNYKLELFLQAPENKLFNSEYKEQDNSYVYKGTLLPQNLGIALVGEIKGTGNSMYIDGTKDSDNYTNPKNGMKVVIPFTVGDAVSVVNVGSWSDLSLAINNPSGSTVAVKLTNDITATDSDYTFSIPENLYVKIDLNGHVINRNLIRPLGVSKSRTGTAVNRGSVFHVEGKLKITDSSPNTPHEGYIINDIWCVKRDDLSGDDKEIIENNSEPKTIYGGIITGGMGYYNDYYFPGDYGGGIFIDCSKTDAKVVMNGGTICGNFAANHGGGVAMYSSDNFSQDVDLAEFIMNGGTICNNVVGKENVAGGEGDGGGIYLYNGSATIQNGHIDNNISTRRGGGIFSSYNSSLTIIGGTIKNNTSQIVGGIYSMGVNNNSLKLKATPGKEIVITGNKCEKKGNVYSFETHISGKVIIKNNTSSKPAKVCGNTGRLYYEFQGGGYQEYANVYNEDNVEQEPYFFEIPYLNGFYYPNDFLIDDEDMDRQSCQQKIYVEGDLTGSDINLTTSAFFSYNFDKQKFNDIKTEVIYNYLTYNPDAKLDDYIHHDGLGLYHLELNKTSGSIYVATTEVKEVKGSEFKDAIDDAIDDYIENEGSKIKIDLTEDIGDKDHPLDTGSDDGLYIPPNVDLDLNGHNVFIGDSNDDGDGDTVVIDGDIKDSGDEEKGKLYLDDPKKLIYDSEVDEDEDEDGNFRFEPVWIPTGGDDSLEGYYCIYKIGANTKWDATAEGDKWEEPGNDAAKFKVQPTAYLNLSEALKNDEYGLVYGENTKVRAGLRLNLYKKNSNKPFTFYFAFSEGKTNSWATTNPTVKCLSVPIKGLAPYEKVEAQAAIYSKPNGDTQNKKIENNSIKVSNARFFSKSIAPVSGD